ncbi:hypothetical protein [Alicyclobacillus herbarius]|uniref:hypothetical protein n=1 Tax=Alicyclobacillus herbarius TaxID=122960 RepID=UPI00047989C2|nr:hypothetical protein [Alicyclobacillus herbarius]
MFTRHRSTKKIGAAAAVVAVVAGASLFGVTHYRHVADAQTLNTKHDVKPDRVENSGAPYYMNTDVYTEANKIKDAATFKVVLPVLPPYKLDRMELDSNSRNGQQLTMWLLPPNYDRVKYTDHTIQYSIMEVPNKTVVGSDLDQPDRLKHVKFDGVDVTVAFPQKDSLVHAYEFVHDGILYDVRSMVGDWHYAVPYQKDKAWEIIDSLIKENHVLN